jgi:hypothetical protein
MPRAGGVYTLPAGNPVVTLTVISSTWANTTMADIATALTGSLPTDGSAPLTGALRLIDGAVNAPGLTWATETTSGLYRIGANQFGFSVAGVNALSVNANRGWNIPSPVAGTPLTINALDATSALTLIDTTSVSGIRITFQDSVQIRGIIGNGSETFTGGAVGDFGISANGGILRLGYGGGTTSISINNTGNIVLSAAASSGSTLVTNGPSGDFAGRFVNTNVGGNSFGLNIRAGSTAADTAINVTNGAASATFFNIFGDGHGTLGSSSTLGLSWTSGGNVTVAAPAAGVSLIVVSTISGIISSFTTNNGQTNGSISAGIAGVDNAQIGVTTDDNAPYLGAGGATLDLRAGGYASANNILRVGTGGIITVGVTGGAQGANTLNVGGLYIAANQLFFGAPASANTTATVTDVGKVINAAGNIAINNAVFSQGHILSIYNNTAAAITINGTITTMRLAGTATTGNRTLAARGFATVWFEGASECVVTGAGVS